MPILLRTEGWSSPPVVSAVGRAARWRGLRPLSDGRALLLASRAVHSVGMKEALWVAGLNRAGIVIDIRLLLPGRALRIPTADWILELPAALPPPPLGSTLEPAAAAGPAPPGVDLPA